MTSPCPSRLGSRDIFKPMEVKVAKEREVGRELNKDEEVELYEKELKRLERENIILKE